MTMEDLLDFREQKWKPAGPGDMTLFLSPERLWKDLTMFMADLRFVPPWF